MAYDDMCPKHAYLEILPCRFHSPVLFATLCNKPYSTPFEVAFSYFHHFCEIRKEWIRQNNYANLQKKIIWNTQTNILCSSKSNWTHHELKTGSDQIIYWLGKYSFFLGFVQLEEKISKTFQHSWVFWNNKTQEERSQ